MIAILGISIYTLVTASKYLWLPMLPRSFFWVVDFICFVIIPTVFYAFTKHLNLINHSCVLEKNSAELKPLENIFQLLLTVLSLYLAIKIGEVASRILAKSYPFVFSAYAAQFNYSQLIPKTGLQRVLVLIYLSATAALVEEYIYRGLLYAVMQDIFRKKPPALVYVLSSTILFSSIHLGVGLPTVIASFFGGIVLAYSYFYSRSLNVVIGAHLIHNLLFL